MINVIMKSVHVYSRIEILNLSLRQEIVSIELFSDPILNNIAFEVLFKLKKKTTQIWFSLKVQNRIDGIPFSIDILFSLRDRKIAISFPRLVLSPHFNMHFWGT